MPKDAKGFAVNDRILHSTYGLGTISEVNAQHTTIVFDEAGRKKFVTSIVRLEHNGTPAPAKPARAPRKKKAATK